MQNEVAVGATTAGECKMHDGGVTADQDQGKLRQVKANEARRGEDTAPYHWGDSLFVLGPFGMFFGSRGSAASLMLSGLANVSL